MATQEDRPLSSSMFLPQWMKTKKTDRFDFEQGAFSPTELDDNSIYYFRSTAPPKPIDSNTTKIVYANDSTVDSNQSFMNASSGGDKQNFANHPLPCQKFLNNTVIDNREAQKVQFPSAFKTKSSGTDDGFKGEAAKCGSSIIKVAHQMVIGKIIGFNMEKGDCPENARPEGFNPSIRRSSKSLPASPLNTPSSSPKQRRRVNKYFTGAFTDTEKHGNWILSTLLSQRKSISQSVGNIPEEESPSDLLKNSASNNNINDGSESKRNRIFVPKPSELREMNFLSPTSM